jgi:hypothetical protein
MGKRPRIPYVPKPKTNFTKVPQHSNKAQALSDIEVKCENKILFSCKEDDVIAFKDIIYKENGEGYLVLDNDIEIKLFAFKLI